VPVARTNSLAGAASTIALHRFIEVSIGIAVALALSVVWPEEVPTDKAD
jgi:uncharacterized membrane protein YccC